MNTESQTIPQGTYGFSSTRISTLEASEYTLVTIVVDESGSVSPFWDEMKRSIAETIKACALSPRADTLMLRIVTFANAVRERIGFTPLSSINDGDVLRYDMAGGSTALYDAIDNAMQASVIYGGQLYDQDFSANAITVIITDGCDNASSVSMTRLAKNIIGATTSEKIESHLAILVGVNIDDPSVSQTLDDVKRIARLQQFIPLKDASKNTLAKLAAFISKSISAQSQALGTGGPSQALSF
jgi:uncharacterized protein YegL